MQTQITQRPQAGGNLETFFRCLLVCLDEIKKCYAEKTTSDREWLAQNAQSIYTIFVQLDVIYDKITRRVNLESFVFVLATAVLSLPPFILKSNPVYLQDFKDKLEEWPRQDSALTEICAKWKIQFRDAYEIRRGPPRAAKKTSY